MRQLVPPERPRKSSQIASDNVCMQITRHTLIRVPWENLLAHMRTAAARPYGSEGIANKG